MDISMTPTQFRKFLKTEADIAGSQAIFAKQCKVSAPYLSDVINGKREAADRLCAAIGFERIIIYRKIRTDGENR